MMNTDYEAAASYAARVKEAYADPNTVVIIDGSFEVRTWPGSQPATVWNNGSLGISIKAKKPGRVNVLYYKVNSPLPTLTVRPRS